MVSGPIGNNEVLDARDRAQGDNQMVNNLNVSFSLDLDLTKTQGQTRECYDAAYLNEKSDDRELLTTTMWDSNIPPMHSSSTTLIKRIISSHMNHDADRREAEEEEEEEEEEREMEEQEQEREREGQVREENEFPPPPRCEGAVPWGLWPSGEESATESVHDFSATQFQELQSNARSDMDDQEDSHREGVESGDANNNGDDDRIDCLEDNERSNRISDTVDWGGSEEAASIINDNNGIDQTLSHTDGLDHALDQHQELANAGRASSASNTPVKRPITPNALSLTNSTRGYKKKNWREFNQSGERSTASSNDNIVSTDQSANRESPPPTYEVVTGLPPAAENLFMR